MSNLPDLPSLTGLDLSVALDVLGGWFSQWRFDFGSSFFDNSTINIGTLR